MIAKLEWTQSNEYQNKDKHRTPTNNVMGSTINTRSTATKPPPKNGQQPKPLEGWAKIHFTGATRSPKILLMLNHDTRMQQIHSPQQEHIQSSNQLHTRVR